MTTARERAERRRLPKHRKSKTVQARVEEKRA